MKKRLLLDHLKGKLVSAFGALLIIIVVPIMLNEIVIKVFTESAPIHSRAIMQTLFCCYALVKMPGAFLEDPIICVSILLDLLCKKEKTEILQFQSVGDTVAVKWFKGKITEWGTIAEFIALSERSMGTSDISVWFHFYFLPWLCYICDKRVYSKFIYANKKYKVTYFKFSKIVTSIERVY